MMATPEDPFQHKREVLQKNTYNKDLIAYGIMWPLVDHLYGADWREVFPPNKDKRTFNDRDNDNRNDGLSARVIASRDKRVGENGKYGPYNHMSLEVDFMIVGDKGDMVIEIASQQQPELILQLNDGVYMIVRRKIAYRFGSDGTATIFVKTTITNKGGEKLWVLEEDGQLHGERQNGFDDQDMNYIKKALRNLEAPSELLHALDVIRSSN